MSTYKLTRRQVRWALDLTAFDFWLVFCKGTLNPAESPSRRPDYQTDAELEDSMTDNTSAIQSRLFSTVAAVTSQPMSPMEQRARQILVIGISDARSSNQRKQARGAVLNKSIYENVSKSLIDALPEFLRAEPLTKNVTQRLPTRKSNSDLNINLCDWTQRGELLYKGSVLYMLEVEALQMKILKKQHDDPLAGHLAIKKTYNTLRHKYFYPNMYKQVDAYCTSCLICQGARVIRVKQPGELQPFPIPTKAWDVLSMDFITRLSESFAYGGTYNAIFVLIDKLSKMCHYIRCRSDMTAGELAEVITQEVIRLHGVSSAIIFDRGSLFTSRLWANLMYSFRIKQQLSTAFHQQTDWQTQRQNSVLEQYLRSHVNYLQDDWAPFLGLAKFGYNTVVLSSTGKAPFKIVYWKVPRSDMLTLDEVQKYIVTQGSSSEGESLIKRKRATCEKVTKSLARAQAYQARTYKKSHCDLVYKVGQKIWLRVKNITIERPWRKLDWQRYCPYRIIERIRKVAYRLDL